MHKLIRKAFKLGEETFTMGSNRNQVEVTMKFHPIKGGMVFTFDPHTGEVRRKCKGFNSLTGIKEIFTRQATAIFLDTYSTRESAIDVGEVLRKGESTELIIMHKN